MKKGYTMKQFKFLLIIFLGIMTSLLSSCSKADGDWPPMKLTKQKITFKAKESIDSIQVTNYSMMWINRIYEGESNYPTKEYYNIDTTYHDAQVIQGDWFQATADIMPSKKNWMYIHVDKNTSGKDRELTITLTVGDVFNDISIKQLAR